MVKLAQMVAIPFLPVNKTCLKRMRWNPPPPYFIVSLDIHFAFKKVGPDNSYQTWQIGPDENFTAVYAYICCEVRFWPNIGGFY